MVRHADTTLKKHNWSTAIELFTTRISNWREARKRNLVFVDTTVKGKTPQGKIFAPTWDMVLGHKDGSWSDEQYTAAYRKRMIASWLAHREEWEAFLRQEEPVAIACYCTPGKFCHRHLLKDIFQELCAKLGIPFLYYGELE